MSWNHGPVYRVYRSLKLNQERPAKKRLPERFKQPLLVPPSAQLGLVGRFHERYAL